MIDYASRAINCKIVYCGPGAGGKTTNLKFLSHKLTGDSSQLVSLSRDDDRTLFFDYLPVDGGTIKGFKTTLNLYSVPGQTIYNALRKPLLKSVHGIVFVADSSEERIEDNLDALQRLTDTMRELGHNLDSIPVVFQYNKRDVNRVAPVSLLQEALNPGQIVADPAKQLVRPDPFHAGENLVEQSPEGYWIERSQYIEAVATDGVGVLDTLRVVGRLALRSVA